MRTVLSGSFFGHGTSTHIVRETQHIPSTLLEGEHSVKKENLNSYKRLRVSLIKICNANLIHTLRTITGIHITAELLQKVESFFDL